MTQENNKELNDAWKTMLDSQQNIFDTWKKSFLLLQPNGVQRDFKETFDNIMKEWMDNQRRMMIFWQDAFSGNTTENTNSNNTSKNFGENTSQVNNSDSTDDSTIGNTTAGNNMLQMPMMPMMPMQQDTGQETTEKMFRSSTNLFRQIYEFWNIFLSGPQNIDPRRLNEISRDWMDNYNKILEEFFPQNLAEPFRTVFLGSTELGKAYNDINQKFLSPWMENIDYFQNTVNRASQGDPNAYIDFLRIWQEAFQNSYGKLFNVPAMGFSRETNEKVLKSIDAFLEYIYSTNEFTLSLYKVGYEAMEKLMNKIQEETNKGNPPKTFKEFYDLWIETNEETYLNLSSQESFARMLGNFVDASVSFKRRYDDLLMEVLNELPIPTDNDMDSVYRKIYELNKDVKENKKYIKELTTEIKELKSKQSFTFDKGNQHEIT